MNTLWLRKDLHLKTLWCCCCLYPVNGSWLSAFTRFPSFKPFNVQCGFLANLESSVCVNFKVYSFMRMLSEQKCLSASQRNVVWSTNEWFIHWNASESIRAIISAAEASKHSACKLIPSVAGCGIKFLTKFTNCLRTLESGTLVIRFEGFCSLRRGSNGFFWWLEFQENSGAFAVWWLWYSWES